MQAQLGVDLEVGHSVARLVEGLWPGLEQVGDHAQPLPISFILDCILQHAVHALQTPGSRADCCWVPHDLLAV